MVAACTSAGGSDGPTINHVQVTAEQQPGQAVPIEAQVTDPDGVASVLVFYQAPHAGSWSSASLTLDLMRADTYTGEIPADAVAAPSVSYYLEAQDRKGNSTRAPEGAPAAPYTFPVAGGGGDTKGPAISHVKIADNRPMGSQVTVSATVSDDTGVASVTCNYRAAGATDWIPLTLTATGSGKYQADFPIEAIVPPAVEYYLEAVDTAPAANRSVLPTNAPDSFFTFTVSPGDETPPVITLTPVADGQPEGRPVAVIARVVDVDSGVLSVTLYYRTHGTSAWEQLAMTQADASSPFTGIIPSGTVTSAGVDYYLEAVDNAPLANTALAPDTAPDTPYTFTTAPETCITPPLAAESFEAGIFPGWWRTYSSGSGCEWTVGSSTGHDGTHSAMHAYGYSCDDLLVLPCLDLTGLESEGLVLDFWQQSSYLSTYEVHTLEWAENNPDPGASTYTVIGSPIPEESASSTWGYRKISIPPGSPMLGKSKVYFAFRYNGDDEWTWYLDEIRVRQPGPAIEFANINASPNPVTAGASDVAVNVTVRNAGDAPSAALTGTLSTTDTGITITNNSASFPGVAAGGQSTSSTAFHLAVAAGHASGDVPLKLHLDDGARTYDLDIPLYVGTRATAVITMATSGSTWESDTELYLGVGTDPSNPEWLGTQIPYVSSDPDMSGTFTYTVDLTAQAAHLPPTLQHPWFLKVVHAYSGTLEIQQFSISYGAASFTAIGLPWRAASGSSSSPAISYLMVPEPPRFVADGVVTTPTALAPNTPNATLAITVRNLGSATEGALTGTLTLKDPTTTADVTGLTPTTAVSFATQPVGNNSTATSASTWTFNVTAAHNDGSPLHFNLHLADGTTGLTWDVPVDVQVPHAGIAVLDWTGATATLDSDGLPDPSEGTFDLQLVIQNPGTQATAGPVTATLSVTSGPATIAGTTMTFGNTALAAGAWTTATNSVLLTLNGANFQDTIVLDAAFTDGTDTWHKPVTIPIYAHVGAIADPQESSSAVPDLRFEEFYCDNTTLEVRVIGWSPVSPTSAALSVIVAHPTSGAAMRLRYYQGTLSAYTLGVSGWETATAPASLKVSYSPAGSTSIYYTFRVALADMATYVSGKQTRLGAQADGYSVTTAYDYLPDAWSSRAPADLVLVSWP